MATAQHIGKGVGLFRHIAATHRFRIDTDDRATPHYFQQNGDWKAALFSVLNSWTFVIT